MKRMILVGLLALLGLSATMGQTPKQKALINRDAQSLLTAIQNVQKHPLNSKYLGGSVKVVQTRLDRLKKDARLADNLRDTVSNVNQYVGQFIEVYQNSPANNVLVVQDVTGKAVAALQELIKSTSPSSP